MLGKFLGRDQKPALPKNQIEVVCPVCGAAQHEPRLVVTTICRKCGEHLRIEKHRVVASSRINPVPSAIYPAESGNASVTSPSPTPPQEQNVENEGKDNALLPGPDEKEVPLGLGHMMGFKDLDDGPRIRAKEQEQELPTTPTPPAEPEPSAAKKEKEKAEPTPTSAASASTFQKMREQGFKQQYFKEAECFDCHHKFKVGRSARSAQCPNCSAQISLEDIDINMVHTAPIRTRGDVYIRKTGNVSTSEIKCRDLRIHGAVSGQIDCSGELTIRTTGTIIGEIHCAKLTVERGSDIHFVNNIHANEVEIHARISGNVQCHGPVAISSTGWIQGDVSARSVAIEPGGQLDGAMNILRSTAPKPKPPTPPAEPPATEN